MRCWTISTIGIPRETDRECFEWALNRTHAFQEYYFVYYLFLFNSPESRAATLIENDTEAVKASLLRSLRQFTQLILRSNSRCREQCRQLAVGAEIPEVDLEFMATYFTSILIRKTLGDSECDSPSQPEIVSLCRAYGNLIRQYRLFMLPLVHKALLLSLFIDRKQHFESTHSGGLV